MKPTIFQLSVTMSDKSKRIWVKVRHFSCAFPPISPVSRDSNLRVILGALYATTGRKQYRPNQMTLIHPPLSLTLTSTIIQGKVKLRRTFRFFICKLGDLNICVLFRTFLVLIYFISWRCPGQTQNRPQGKGSVLST